MARIVTALTFLLCSHVVALPTFEVAETVDIEFRVFGVGKDSYEELYLYNGTSYERLEFHRTNRSIKKYRYKGPSQLAIYVPNPKYSVNEPDSLKYLPVTSTSVDIGLNEGLLIFAATQNNRELPNTERRFKLIMIDDETENFPQNSLVVVNTTNVMLHGRIANERLQLAPGASPPITYSSTQSPKGVPIIFALDTSDGMRLVLSNEVQLPNNRRIVLILEPPRRKNSFRLEARMLSESLESRVETP